MTDSPVACPHCSVSVPAEANFCPACGGALRGPACIQCGAASGGGDRFCTQCGAALPLDDDDGSTRAHRGRSLGGVPSGTASPSATTGWSSTALRAVAGTVLAAAAILVLVLVLRPSGDDDGQEGAASPSGPPSSPASAGQPVPLGPTSAVDLSSMSPREAARRLFNRVMTAVEGGNQAEAAQFLPMAVAAYDRVGALTLDDRFHVSLLHAAGQDGAQALAVAEACLAIRPTHLLCLSAAAEAALLLGDSTRAASHYRTLVESYNAELQSGLLDYTSPQEGHPDLLPTMLNEARAFLDGGP